MSVPWAESATFVRRERSRATTARGQLAMSAIWTISAGVLRIAILQAASKPKRRTAPTPGDPPSGLPGRTLRSTQAYFLNSALSFKEYVSIPPIDGDHLRDTKSNPGRVFAHADVAACAASNSVVEVGVFIRLSIPDEPSSASFVAVVWPRFGAKCHPAAPLSPPSGANTR